jgi:hypothetical protein
MIFDEAILKHLLGPEISPVIFGVYGTKNITEEVRPI